MKKIFGYAFRLYTGKKGLGFRIYKLPKIKTAGWVNETQDHMFVFFGDYDNVDYNVVKNDIFHLNKVFNICTFAVLKNSEDVVEDFDGTSKTIGNYGVFSFCKMTYEELLKVLEHARVDWWTTRVPRFYSQRNWVQRLWEKFDGEKIIKDKPTVKEVFQFPPCKREHSFAHKKFAEKFLQLIITPIRKHKAIKWDTFTDVELITYGTR